MVDFEKTRDVKKVWIGRILGMNPTGAFRLIKIDVDSIDEQILDWILDKIAENTLSVDSFVIEAPGSGAICTKHPSLGTKSFPTLSARPSHAYSIL